MGIFFFSNCYYSFTKRYQFSLVLVYFYNLNKINFEFFCFLLLVANNILIQPNVPSITRLADDKVMVRWSINQPHRRQNIQLSFWKIQYRNHLDINSWKTLSANIPPDVRLYEVDGLQAGEYYRFRVAAVYSDNDFRFSYVSKKFLLQHSSKLGPIRSNLTSPNLTSVEPSKNSVMLHWYFPTKPSSPIEGFYAYYRPATTAGEYYKTTIEGMDTKQFKIEHLTAGTAYEFKLQSFTSSAASDFSSIITGKTLSTHIYYIFDY